MPTAPDRSCDIGSATHGHRVYLWSCYEDRKVVIYKYSAEMSAHAPIKETAACGELTKFETEHSSELGPDCAPVPAELAWQVSH